MADRIYSHLLQVAAASVFWPGKCLNLQRLVRTLLFRMNAALCLAVSPQADQIAPLWPGPIYQTVLAIYISRLPTARSTRALTVVSSKTLESTFTI